VPGALAGQLLVASPVLEDPNFARTVVLLLEHTEDGALGLVLNRPSTTSVGDALPQWLEAAAEPAQVFLGGPVEPQAAICLAESQVADVPDEGWRVLDSVAPTLGVLDLGADPAAVPSGLRLRVFAGYAGWSAAQLETEISMGGWYVLDARPADILTTAPADLWRDVLRRQGGTLALVSTFPTDPRLN
jgi:putative transcriptional regulator